MIWEQNAGSVPTGPYAHRNTTPGSEYLGADRKMTPFAPDAMSPQRIEHGYALKPGRHWFPYRPTLSVRTCQKLSTAPCRKMLASFCLGRCLFHGTAGFWSYRCDLAYHKPSKTFCKLDKGLGRILYCQFAFGLQDAIAHGINQRPASASGYQVIRRNVPGVWTPSATLPKSGRFVSYPHQLGALPRGRSQPNPAYLIPVSLQLSCPPCQGNQRGLRVPGLSVQSSRPAAQEPLTPEPRLQSELAAPSLSSNNA